MTREEYDKLWNEGKVPIWEPATPEELTKAALDSLPWSGQCPNCGTHHTVDRTMGVRDACFNGSLFCGPHAGFFIGFACEHCSKRENT